MISFVCGLTSFVVFGTWLRWNIKHNKHHTGPYKNIWARSMLFAFWGTLLSTGLLILATVSGVLALDVTSDLEKQGWEVISANGFHLDTVVRVNGVSYYCVTTAEQDIRVIRDLSACRNLDNKLNGYLRPKDIKEAQKGYKND